MNEWLVINSLVLFVIIGLVTTTITLVKCIKKEA